MDIIASGLTSFSPVIGPNTVVDEGHPLDVVRIRLAILKLPHQS
jgi:hypothetical protein